MLSTNPSKWNQTSWDEHHPRDMYKCFSHMRDAATSIWNYRTRATVSSSISIWACFQYCSVFGNGSERMLSYNCIASLQSHNFNVALISIHMIYFRSTNSAVKYIFNAPSHTANNMVTHRQSLDSVYAMFV